MIHAFNISYLNRIQKKLSIVIDYLAYFLKYTNEQIQNTLVHSKVINHLMNANPYYAGGKSGRELCLLIADEQGIENPKHYEETFGKTPEYWTGYALAYYMWYTYRSFERIFYAVRYEDILMMYHPYHEMDITRFVEDLNIRIEKGTKDTNLKIIRMAANLSQSQLAKESGVSLRSIQLYEQRVNDIDKAQSQTLFKLAKTLGCSIENLLENPQRDF